MFRDKLSDLVQKVGRKTFLSLTGVPPSTLSIWLTSDTEPSDLRKLSICRDVGVDEDYFKPLAEMKTAKKSFTCLDASRLMGCSVEFVHCLLQQGRVQWGYAILRNKSWSYWINEKKFKEIEGYE